VEFPAVPTVTLTVAGLAATVKSWTTKVTIVACDLDAAAPVTLTWTVDAELKVHESVPLPEPVTLVGETVHEVLFVVRLTTPAKPLTAVIVIVDVPAVPAFTVTVVGVAVIVKFTMLYVTVTECDSEPLVPVTPTCAVAPVVNVQDSVALPEPV